MWWWRGCDRERTIEIYVKKFEKDYVGRTGIAQARLLIPDPDRIRVTYRTGFARLLRLWHGTRPFGRVFRRRFGCAGGRSFLCSPSNNCEKKKKQIQKQNLNCLCYKTLVWLQNIDYILTGQPGQT